MHLSFPGRTPFSWAPIRASNVFESLILALALSALAFWINADQSISWADEGLLWYGSQRVQAGELPVRDFYAYDPGRYFWTAAFYEMVSDHSLRTTLLAGSAFACMVLTVLLVSMSRAGLSRGWRVLLAVTLTIAFAFPRHKIFDQSLSLLLACVILLVLEAPESRRRWLVLGIASGLAATMGRNHGVFYVLAALLTGGYLLLSARGVRPWEAASRFALGVVIGYLPMIALFFLHPGFLTDFWRSVLLTGQWQLSLPIPFPWSIQVDDLPPLWAAHLWLFSIMCLLIPASYLATLGWVTYRSRLGERRPLTEAMTALSLAGLPYLHQAFDRADFGHFVQGVLPALGVFVCTAAFLSSVSWRPLAMRWGSLVMLTTSVALWIPYVPYVQMSLLERHSPGATRSLTMDATVYRIESYQARLLSVVREMARDCQIKDREFLAAPHFPGLYAFLGVRAPAWETYYLHNRPAEMQEAHRQAMASIRLAVIAPELTIDNLDRLRFRRMHGASLTELERILTPYQLSGLPFPLTIYTSPQTCPIPSPEH